MHRIAELRHLRGGDMDKETRGMLMAKGVRFIECYRHHRLPTIYWGEECPWCALYEAAYSVLNGQTTYELARLSEALQAIDKMEANND